MRKFIILVTVIVILLGLWSEVKKYSSQFFAGFTFPFNAVTAPSSTSQPVKIESEESVTVNAVKKIGPSVVTVAGIAPQTESPFPNGLNPFFFFQTPDQNPSQNQDQLPNQTQSIGSGFIVSSDGLIITNKHVVADATEKYQIITANDKKYDVQKIYRDPVNDIAIVKIDPSQNSGVTLQPVTLGDSSRLQVGQFAIAIGTALGEFRNTVTTGVISGLGRGITAGDQFQGSVENLSNVIQTSAAVNPGNSGGPLVNSSSQVIGMNTAIAQSGQNIGFALPINVVKDALKNFNDTGSFNRAYLGVAYKVINKDVALLNNVPEGAYIQTVISGSPADKAGLQQGDIIVSIDGKRLTGNNTEISTIISSKKPGDTITINYWRNDKTQDTSATLTAAPNQ